MILVDSGPLVAAANRRDQDHDRCLSALTSAARPRLVPGPVIAETCYLLARDARPGIEADFLRSFTTGFFEPADLTPEDLARAADLVDEYADLRLGGTDACVVAIAERLGINQLATLDRRHFSVVRPRHVEAFVLLPT